MIPVTDTKEVSGTELRKGDRVLCYTLEKPDGTKSRITTGHWVLSTEKGITLGWDDGEVAKKELPYSYVYSVYISEDEFVKKYEDKASEVIRGLKNIVPDVFDLGAYSDENEWIRTNPYEMAKRCLKNDIKIIGFVPKIIPKFSWNGKRFTCAVVGKRLGDGERIWWAAEFSSIKKMISQWNDTHQAKNDASEEAETEKEGK